MEAPGGLGINKDIDIFVPDPQYLGFVSPRLSDAAERVSADYVEGPGYVKLLRPEGEIDFVASPNLTAQPYDEWTLLGRTVSNNATTRNSSPLLTCSVITLMLSCAGSKTLDELRRTWCGSLRLRRSSAHISLAVVAADDGQVAPGVAFSAGSLAKNSATSE